MSMKSKIETSERVNNKQRRFGSNIEYFPCMIIDDTGKEIPALFTKNQLDVAAARAERNMEDMPKESNWYDWLFTEL